MSKQLALGKGLGALLEENDVDTVEQSSGTPVTNAEGALSGARTDASTAHAATEIEIDPKLLKPNPFQPRTEFSEESLNELAESIRLHGIIQPILAQEAGDGTYYIIAGERRTRAAERAGLQKVPVLIRTFTDEKKLEVALIENIQRENLNPIEEARAYQRLMQLENLNQDEVAKRVGKNRSTVANAMRLLKLPEDMLNAVASGAISAGHARALLAVVNPSDQRVLFARMMGSGMSVRDAEQAVLDMNNGARAKPVTAAKKSAAPKSADIASIEQQFIEALGTKAVIKGSLERGSIEIEYFSRADLDRLYALFTGNGA